MPATPRAHHPAILEVGTIDRRDDHTVIAGWTLGNCARRCTCHRHPLSGQIVVANSPDGGTLGLCRFNNPSCGCCTLWTAAELDAVLTDLHDLTTLETT